MAFKDIFRKAVTLSGLDPTGKSNVKFKSPALNRFVEVRQKAKNTLGGIGAGVFGASALKKAEKSPISEAAKKFAASDAGGKLLSVVENQKEQVQATNADTSGVNASFKLIEWLKKNFVWVLGVVVAVIALPIIWGFMKRGSKRTPSRRKPISRPVKRTSYRGKSTSTRAKQLAALARGRATRRRNLKARKK